MVCRSTARLGFTRAALLSDQTGAGTLAGCLTCLQDKYRRVLAETENVRARGRRDTENARLFGIQKFAKEVWPPTEHGRSHAHGS